MNTQPAPTAAARPITGPALSAAIRSNLGSECLVRLSQITDVLKALAPTTKRDSTWIGYETTDGGFFMAPSSPQRIQVPAYGVDETLTGEAAGALACLYAYEQIGSVTMGKRIVALRNKLLSYIRSMPEGSIVLACAGQAV